ncbi:MAG TPA: hypothetical protein VK212_01445 [Lentimicrobium sp.]|nr:hypothetical protein [Lentimicrobium sp.]
MAQFSSKLNQVSGLRFIADAMELQSPLGRQHLLKQKFMTSSREISLQLDKIEELVSLFPADERTNSDQLGPLKHALSEVRDISGTLNALHAGMVLDDIGLFEVKRFALIIYRLISILGVLKCKVVEFSDVSQVIAILDPDKQRIAHFYIYDSYSEKLADIRKQYQQLTNDTLKTDYSDDPKGKQKSADLQRVEELRLRTVAIEDEIRKDVSIKLRGYSVILLENLSSAADLDLWLAKALLAITLGLSKPTISEKSQHTIYKQLFNPAIRAFLQDKGKTFQPVDIEIYKNPTLITGANMAGKTVVLKTVALAQTLFQFGFFVPAMEAIISPVDKVMTSMEDEQSELKGLSSFASEMMNLNSIIHAAREGANILTLIDEPAKTTNPREGEALVSALLEILINNNVSGLITTHYTIDLPKCRRLRVAGLKTREMLEMPSIENIQDHIDYSLVELTVDDNHESSVPKEALTIASILNVDKELLNIAAKYLNISRQ